MAAPLAGIRVVDLGQWMAAPTAARLLADNGADVVRVDPPGGWRWSCEADIVLNAGKQRLQLNLDHADGLEEVHRLIGRCDVLIDSSSPGRLERFGLDPTRVRTAYPRLVHLSLPGFASTDEKHAAAAAWEGVVASATGQFCDMGVNRILRGIPASYSPLPLGSAYAGVFGAMAVGLALRARLRHGQGEHIEVPIASSLLEALAYNSMQVQDVPSRYLSRRERAINSGRRGLSFSEVQSLMDPFYRTYWCADDRPFYVVAVSHRHHSRKVLELLGLWDEAVAEGMPDHDPYLSTSQWPDGADCTLRAHPISTPWAQWLSERIAVVLRTRTSREWEEEFAAWGIPAVGTRTTREWMQTEHALASGLVIEDHDDQLGVLRRMGPVVWTEDVQGAADQGTGAPLSTVGGQSADRDSRPEAGWLQGSLVVDLTNVIAGPTIGSTLARYGARVVKVDLPDPTFDPWNTVLCGFHSNRGKESVLLDGRSELGRPALRRLLERADVVTVNASEDQLARLGLTGAELADIAPRAVLCHLDAWSGPAGGPWRQRPGYDDLVQASTGVMARFGGGLDTPEEHAHFGTIDVLAGLAAAAATAFALYARDATGEVVVARSSLAAAGQLIQAPYLIAHSSPPIHEPSGPSCLGEHEGYRVRQTQDGWAFVVVPPELLAELRPALDSFAEHPGWHWQERLCPLGVTVQPLATLHELRERHTGEHRVPWTDSSYHFTTTRHAASGREVTLVAPVAVRPRTARIVVPADARKYGADTIAVLTELGYDRDEIDQMLLSGAAGTSWSDEYLPS